MPDPPDRPDLRDRPDQPDQPERSAQPDSELTRTQQPGPSAQAAGAGGPVRTGPAPGDRAPIDWGAVVRVAIRAAPTGPNLSAAEAARAVMDLRSLSREAESAVREVTGMGLGDPVLDGVVVDRPGWITATTEGMAILTDPLSARLAEHTAARQAGRAGRRLAIDRSGGRAASASASAAAVPIGSVLGYLSGKVLGQFDPFVADPAQPQAPGRLLLVAPNIVKVERLLDADPRDFRMWVCLHESTHRLQFTAVPWLRDYFRSLVAEFADAADLDASVLVERVRSAWKTRSAADSNWIQASQTPQQREIFDRLLALMTVLEGHADHVMDAVGPRVIPSVAQIRSRFNARRKHGSGPIDRLIRAVLGMDLKMRQYVQGAGFVSAVVQDVGMPGFNVIWKSPQTLPSRAEIADPAAWVARVQP